MRNVTSVFSQLYFRACYEGRENVPATGAFVLAPVHRSNLDFALMSALTKRQLRFMSKASIFKYTLFGRIIAAMGSYPVSRGKADREALSRTIDVLGEGDGMVLFPEGTRKSGPVVERAVRGGRLRGLPGGRADHPRRHRRQRAGHGQGGPVPPPGKMRVIVGPPLYPPAPPEGRRHPSRTAIHELTHSLQRELQRLLDQAGGRRVRQRFRTRVSTKRTAPGVS